MLQFYSIIMTNKSKNSSFQQKAVAWGVHLLTASGVIWAMLAVLEIMHRHAGRALIWLLVAQIIDGIDGPMARRFNVRKHAPVIDGHILDLVIDYMTCVVVPVLFALQFHVFPRSVELWLAGSILYVSALWFSRVDIETKDMWFRGFPTAWNLLITLFWLMKFDKTVNVFVSVIFVLLTLTPQVKFFHILSSKQNRPVTVGLTLSAMIALICMVETHHVRSPIGRFVVLLWAFYSILMTIWRSLQGDEIQ